MRPLYKILATSVVVLVAVLMLAWKYSDYIRNPWTRDGQVRADILQVSPRVSGPIVELPIVDNQYVKTGDLLFRIDPRTYEAALAQAKANYDQTLVSLDSLDRQIDASRATVAQAQSQIIQSQARVRSAQASVNESSQQLARYAVLVKDGNVSRSVYDAQNRTHNVNLAQLDEATAALTQAKDALNQSQADLATMIAKRGAKGEDNAQLRAAKAALVEARLNLEFTHQRASVDGYVTNLDLQMGSQANANTPVLALVDVNSFWVDGYFRESIVGSMAPGDKAYVTLMSYPDTVISGKIESIAWGIAKQDGTTSTDLLPTVKPSFEWIRLAQRIPIKVRLDQVPDGVKLRVGTTASVLVRTRDKGATDTPPPAPVVLQ